MDHLLNQLVLPDRYERLADLLGLEVVNLLVPPDKETLEMLQLLASEVLSRDEGILVPVLGDTGAGKTTFTLNVSQWLPKLFVPTFMFDGRLDHDHLVEAVKKHARALPADNQRILPINIDHRENNPPTDVELSSLKRFLRTNTAGVPSILLWPETNEKVANDIADRYIGISGTVSIELPLRYSGPDRSTWIEIAKHTLHLSNHIENLEDLGVDPADYNPMRYRTLGDFIRTIARDFNTKLQAMRKELEKPLRVMIVFASESPDPGVLSQLTSPARYGLLDGHALVSVTSQSEIGRWWSGRRGLLTRTIVQLNAMALSLSPTAAASCVRNFSDSAEVLDEVGYRRYGSARGVRDLKRSDVGKILANVEISRFEARGTPAEDATAAFQLLAEQGFNLGKDRNLNRIMLTGIESLLQESDIPFITSTAEESLGFCALIPDNAIYFDEYVQCIEYTWRKGEFLSSGNRSSIAQYVLTKLQKYVRQLGWTSD